MAFLSGRVISLLGLLSVGLIVLGLLLIRIPHEHFRQPFTTGNVGELTAGVLVGQTFVAEGDRLSGIGVNMATYSGRVNTQPVYFRLREWPEGDVIREVVADPAQFNDNQFYIFAFAPVSSAQGKTYFFSLVSPQSKAGDAVTVNVNAKDLYTQGSAFLLRASGDLNEVSQSILDRSGKPTLDVSFSLVYETPLRMVLIGGVRDAYSELITSWPTQRGVYITWAIMAAAALGFWVGALVIATRREDSLARRHWVAGGIGLLMIAGGLLRWWYANDLPVTNDEGNYLYDAWMLHQGTLAGGDGYVKAPLVIAWMAIWQWFLGPTLMAGRMASVVAGALTIIPLFYLGRELAGWRAGLIGAAAWALFGAPVVFTIYAHTQPLMLLFATSGLAILMMALRGTTPRVREAMRQIVPAAPIWFFWAGTLLGLASVSRKSALALGLVVVALVLTEGRSWRLRIQHVIAVGLGFLLVLGLVVGWAHWTYGTEGIFEVLGINSAEDGLTGLDATERERAAAYSVRGLTPFFRESLPLILFSVLALGLVGEALIRRWGWSKLAWLIPIGVFWWAWNFFSEQEAEGYMAFGMRSLWYGLAFLIAFVAVWWGRERQPEPSEAIPAQARQPWRQLLSTWVVPVVWLTGLIIFYLNWIKFHANYIGEFLPPLTVLTGIGLVFLSDRFRERRVAWWAMFGVASVVGVWAIYVSNFVTLWYPHTGTFEQRAAAEAAGWARQHIPLDQTIFTGAALIPYLSHHRVALDIGHPRWYAYEFTRTNTGRITAFLPSADAMVQAFRDTEWFLLDEQTGFSYLMEYSEIERGLETDFVQVKGIENGSNTLTFYRRIRNL